MTTETGTFTPTDEDVERAARACWPLVFENATDHGRERALSRARDALATIGPIIERERRAAKAEALRGFAAHLRDIPTGVNRAHDYWISQVCAADEAEHVTGEIERGE